MGTLSRQGTLANQSSAVFNLTLDELQQSVGPGKPFGSMNMEEFLQMATGTVWDREPSQMPSTSDPMPGDAAFAADMFRQPASTSGLEPLPGTFSIPSDFSGKTVDEVWRAIHASQPEAAGTFEAVTLGNFLETVGTGMGLELPLQAFSAALAQQPAPGGGATATATPGSLSAPPALQLRPPMVLDSVPVSRPQPPQSPARLPPQQVQHSPPDHSPYGQGAGSPSRAEPQPASTAGQRVVVQNWQPPGAQPPARTYQPPVQQQQPPQSRAPAHLQQLPATHMPPQQRHQLPHQQQVPQQALQGRAQPAPQAPATARSAPLPGTAMGMPPLPLPHNGMAPLSGVPIANGSDQQPAMSPGAMARAARQRKRKEPEVTDERVNRLQRRMVKNRESAARSRMRKQAYTAELEQQVAELKQQNQQLLQKVIAACPPPAPPNGKAGSLRAVFTGAAVVAAAGSGAGAMPPPAPLRRTRTTPM